MRAALRYAIVAALATGLRLPPRGLPARRVRRLGAGAAVAAAGDAAVGESPRLAWVRRRVAKLGAARTARLNPNLKTWTPGHLARLLGVRTTTSPARRATADETAADRVTLAGAAVNVALSALKLAAGVYGNSAAMLSDAAHSFSDLISDGVTLVAMRASRLPADSDHPYGHGRFETIGAMFVGAMLVAAAAGVGGHATDALLGVRGARAHAHIAPGGVALAAALVSVVAKEALYRVTAAVGRRITSPVLEANAWHHRSDAMTSVVALVGIAAAKYGAGGALAYADAGAALVVAAMLGGARRRNRSPVDGRPGIYLPTPLSRSNRTRFP
jgi:hypothetical protein